MIITVDLCNNLKWKVKKTQLFFTKYLNFFNETTPESNLLFFFMGFMVCLCSRVGFLQVLTFPPTVQRQGHGLSVESKLYFLFRFLSGLVSDWWPVQVVSCLSTQDIWDCLLETESFNYIFHVVHFDWCCKLGRKKGKHYKEQIVSFMLG